MSVPASAERVLLGETLEDKLAPLDTAVVVGFVPPDAPGRPPSLPLRDPRKAAVPRPSALLDERARGRVLHAFVNHELLALELFALALLRFPEAPRGLRHAWCRAATDEQRHLAGYLARMRACGVELGDEPVSAFFWDALHEAPDPMAFTLGMALVLEQANLDFTRGWQQAFSQAGDAETAAVLGEVYEDEIRHVRVGAACLRRLAQEQDRPPLQILQERLCFPLQLARARARGFPFDRQGRLRAGLDEASVDALSVASGSLGRSPRLFWFDPFTEDELAGRSIARPELALDLATLPMFLAGADDVVLAPAPSVPFLQSLSAAGFALPQFLDPRAGPEALPGGQKGEVRPWARGPRAARLLAAFGATDDPRLHGAYDRRFALEHHEAWTAGLSIPLQAPGQVCATLLEVDAAVRASPTGSAVIKALLSTAGGHRVRVEGSLDDRARIWVEKTLCADGAVLVEPWFSVQAELSVLGEVAGGTVRLAGTTRFGAHAGVYRGTVLGPADRGCSPEVRRLLCGEPRAAVQLERLGQRVGETLAGLGLTGPYGVDLLILSQEGTLRVKLGEINPRTTMGHVALAIRRKLAPGTVGAHLILPVRTLTPSLRAHLGTIAPPLCEGGRLARGFLPTTEADSARALCAALWVGPSWREAVTSLHEALAAHPDGAAVGRSLRWLQAEDATAGAPPPHR